MKKLYIQLCTNWGKDLKIPCAQLSKISLGSFQGHLSISWWFFPFQLFGSLARHLCFAGPSIGSGSVLHWTSAAAPAFRSCHSAVRRSLTHLSALSAWHLRFTSAHLWLADLFSSSRMLSVQFFYFLCLGQMPLPSSNGGDELVEGRFHHFDSTAKKTKKNKIY